MVLTGDIIAAAEAQRLGLVNRVVPPDQLEEATLELASKLAAKSPLALQAGKAGLYAMQNVPYSQALNMLSDRFAALCSTEDAEEGVKAFLEKRPPVWRSARPLFYEDKVKTMSVEDILKEHGFNFSASCGGKASYTKWTKYNGKRARI